MQGRLALGVNHIASKPASAVRLVRLALIPCLLSQLWGCVSMIGSMAADTLTASILNQNDPALIESGVPAYLLLVDGFIHQSPDNADLLAAGAQIYALYGTRFSADSEAAVRLTHKARDYGRRALCEAQTHACHWDGMAYPEFTAELELVGVKQIDYLYMTNWKGGK
jgi:hypothetical protein